MPMIQCPECGTNIAATARTCPYCGYVGDDPAQPIGAQAVYEPAPQLQFEIERWNPRTDTMDTQRVDLAPEDNRRIWDALKDWKHVQAMLPALAEAVLAMARSEKQWVADIPKYYAPEDNRRIWDALKDWKHVQAMLPALAEAVLAMARSEKQWVADIPKYYEKLLDDGQVFFRPDRNGQILPHLALAEAVLAMARSEKQWVADIPKYYEKLLDDGQVFFRPDRNGQILPHLVGKNGRIVKQARLKEIVTMPELLPNLQHLETQTALAMIMSQLENVQEQIAQIRGELQQDRLAKADAAWDQLNQAHLETQTALAMIMSQLENVQEQIAQIRGELQQDRLAKADAAWDQLNQALKITDGRRREQAVMIAIGEEQIAQIRGELQQDRLAKADAAWDQLNQALKITDGRRREQAVMIAIGAGTEAKRTLMRHFAGCRALIEGNADQSEWQLILGDLFKGTAKKEAIGAGTEAKRTLMRHFAGCRALIEGNADQSEWQLILGDLFKGTAKKERGEIEARMAYDDLDGILNCVRVETAGHMAIGDTDAARCSLKEFATFIETEQLDDRDTILKIDSRLPSAQKRPEVVDEFDAIAQRTMQLS